MASLNKVMVIGNLGKDPEVRFTGGGQAVANFSIATTEKWKTKEGTWEEKPEWHNIVAWGKLAERCREYLRKGRSAFVEGRLQTSSWQDKDGNKRYKTEIIAQNVQFLGGRGEAPAGGSFGGGGGGDAEPAAGGAQEGPPAFNADEDIPF